jgi:hypothetical protein
MTTNSNSDAVVSLGTGSQRFKDLYLSGTASIGNQVNAGRDTAYDTEGNLICYGSGQNSLIIQTSDNLLDRGIAWRNSGGAYIGNIYITDAGSNIGDMVFGVAAVTQTDVTNVQERMRIDTSGNVGIGATSIDEKLHIEVSSGDAAIKLEDASGDFVRIDQNSVGANDKIRFKTGSGLDEQMRITSAGHVLINTTALQGVGGLSLQVGGSGVSLQNNTTTGAGNGYEYEVFRRNSTQIGSISMNGTTAVQYNTSSDYRLKENVVTEWDATTRLKQLKPSRFNFITEPDRTVDGFLAHEVQDIVPEAIAGAKDAVDADGNPKYQGIDQSKLVPLLVKTIQELEARITALES